VSLLFRGIGLCENDTEEAGDPNCCLASTEAGGSVGKSGRSAGDSVDGSGLGKVGRGIGAVAVAVDGACCCCCGFC